MRKVSRFILGAIFGGMLGSTLVLLLAPGSGDETRAAIQQRLAEIKNQMQKAVNEKKADLEEELEILKTV